MKRKILALALLIALAIPTQAKADTTVYKAKATAYCLTGTTATGTQTKAYKTVASKPEYFGATIYIWLDDGDGVIKPENFILCGVVEDTSKAGSPVATGKVLDIYIPDYNECKEFGAKNVLYQIVKAEG